MTFMMIILCMLLFQWRLILGYTHSDVTRLIEDLFNDTRYNKLIRPIYDQSKVMKVNITPGIDTFESLDVTTGELLTFSYIRLSWIDEFLVWNPADYGGITKLSLPFDEIWVPALSQSNGALKDNTGFIINPGFAPVLILPNGFVLLVTTGYYVTKCNIDTRFYPFDSHQCIFTFFSALYDTTQMDLNSHSGNFALDLVQENYAWFYTDTKYEKIDIGAENIAYYLSGTRFSITIRRRSTFELINSYIPILLLTVLNVATNFVPGNSGERLTFAITLYLSFIFITSALVDEMPHVAVKIAFSSYIMLSLNALNTASVLWSVVIVRMSGWQKSNRKIPNLLRQLVYWYRKENMTKKNKIYPSESESYIEDLEINKEVKEEGTRDNKECDEENELEEDITWSDVTDILDKSYFTVTTILVVGVILVMVCLWLLSE